MKFHISLLFCMALNLQGEEDWAHLYYCATPAPQPVQVFDPPLHAASTNRQPDPVASGLMAIPIFPFAIHSLAFHPDGQILATGNGEGVLRLWDLTSGKWLTVAQAHSNWVFSIAWSSDGKYLVTGGGDNRLRRVRLANPAPVETLDKDQGGHTADIHAVVLSPDNRTIYSAGDDRRILRWQSGKQEPAHKWIAHQEPIPTLALSPDGKLLASGSRDDSIRLWNASNGRLEKTLIGHSDDVMSVRFSPDGKWLASASYDQTVRLWEVATGKAIRNFHGHTDRVFSVAFSPDQKRLASAGDSTLRIWDVGTGANVKTISPGGAVQTDTGKVPENLSSVAFSPDGKTLAVGSTTGNTFIISPETGEILKTLRMR